MTSSMVMERASMGMPGMGMGTMMQGYGRHGHDAGQRSVDDGASLHDEDGEVQRWHEDHM